MNETDEILLRRIANHQMLHGSFCGDPGILNGKMGVVIFFFHYARHTGNTLYEDFAGEMLDEVLEDLHDEVPIRFSNGLSGIGWGIGYLVQLGFVELLTNDILQEIDEKIMECDPLRIRNHSFETGLLGIASYVNMRLSLICNGMLPFDNTYLESLRRVCNETWNVGLIWKRILEPYSLKDELSWKVGLNLIKKEYETHLFDQ